MHLQLLRRTMADASRTLTDASSAASPGKALNHTPHLISRNADCCRFMDYAPKYGVKLGSTALDERRSVENTPAACAALCAGVPGCSFFSHSKFYRKCVFCSVCDVGREGLARHHDAWAMADPARLTQPPHVPALEERLGGLDLQGAA